MDGRLLLTYSGEYGSMRFAVDPGGREIWADWSEDCRVRSVNDATGLLVGPVFGGLLRLRGVLSLHASVVEVSSRAVVLLGEPGTGKSTLAVAAAEQGHAVLSDDIAAVTEHPGGGWLAHAGYPRLRLGSEAIDALSAEEAGPVWTGDEKRYLGLSTAPEAPFRFRSEPLPVGAIYELRRDPELASPRLEPVTGANRVATLVRHLRAALAPLDAASQSTEFAQLGRLAASVPVRRLTVPDDLGALPAVCRSIADVAA